MKLPIHSILIAGLLGSASGWASAATVIDVFKSPYCGCCGGWVEIMQKSGFKVTTHDVSDVPAERKKLGMPERLASCHTAHIGSYVIEGHVPVADIARLLKEKPKALGLAVPGMVAGSPGMPAQGNPTHYDTLLVQTDGTSRIFAQH